MKPTTAETAERRRLILRDELALYRTRLANERTLLAYLRAGVGLIIAGVTIMHFAEHSWFWVVGILCVPGGLLTSLIGMSRYRTMKRTINRKGIPR